MKARDAIAWGLSAASAIAGIAFAAYYIKTEGGGGSGGNLTVTVNVTTGGIPFEGAAVTLGASLPQVTDANGDVTFSGFKAGFYTLSVAASGFQSVSEEVSVSLTTYSFQVPLQATITCTPTPCGCGDSFSLISCACVPQQFARLDVLATYNFSMSWSVIRQGPFIDPFPVALCGFATPGNPSACPGGGACCGGSGQEDTIQIDITAVVKDVNGAPMCGVTVAAGQAGLTSIRWATGDFNGVFNVSLVNSTAVSDAAGKATFTVSVQIASIGCSSYDPAQDGPYSKKAQVPFTVVLSAGGLNAPVELTMNAQICEYYPACLGF